MRIFGTTSGRPWRATLWLCAGALGVGCGASTEYVPARNGHAYLVLEDGVLGFYRDGKTAPAFSGDPAANLLSCNEQATTRAIEAQGHMQSAQTALTVGAVFGLIGAFVTSPIAASHQEGAMVSTIDALNLHNDLPACVSRPAVSSKRSARAPIGGHP